MSALPNQLTTIVELLARSAGRLRTLSGSPELDSRLLLGFVLKQSFVQLIARGHQQLSAEEFEQYQALLARRIAGEPIAYIVGRKEFYGRDFEVSPAVLIPRPETEMLVDAALEFIAPRKTEALAVVDLGTGSGCIAVSLAAEARRYDADLKVLATDRSREALSIAARNAQAHGVTITFLQADWLQPLAGGFDLILSNPPYLALAEVATASPETRFEPRTALFAGEDGLDDVKRLLRALPELLKPGGLFLCEIGAGQRAAIDQLIADRQYKLLKGFQHSIENDLAGRARMLALRREP